jgi:hypothetical protein
MCAPYVQFLVKVEVADPVPLATSYKQYLLGLINHLAVVSIYQCSAKGS